MDATEVTQGDYQSLMGVNPSQFKDNPKRPVENMTWFDAVLYCNARSKRDGLDTVYRFMTVLGKPGSGCRDLVGLKIDLSSNGYRLPTEAEWEYACRAGTTTEYSWGSNFPPLVDNDTSAIDSNAVWYHNSTSGTQPVKTKKPNPWGMYDMAGNAWEWCNDWNDGYGAEAETDPAGPDTGSCRILRGGSWCDINYGFIDRFLRSAHRYYDYPEKCASFRGFRCVRRQ